MAIKLIITDAGKQALVDAKQTGTAKLTLAEIAVGDGAWRYDEFPSSGPEAITELSHEVKRLPIIAAGVGREPTGAPVGNTINVAFQDDSADSYEVHEFGVYTSDGVLFAYAGYFTLEDESAGKDYSFTVSKAANAILMLAIDMIIDDLDVNVITFGNVSYSISYATTENAGSIQIATEDEAQDGESTTRAITPATLHYVVNMLFNSSFESSFTTAFNDAFESYFPAAFSHMWDDKFSESFNSAYQAAFDRAFTAALPSAFAAKLATNAEALAGTSTNEAVTPAALKYTITNFSGQTNKMQVTATGATAARTLAARFADQPSPLDYGAKGDGTTNDASAFTALENSVTGQFIDLCGKNYVVTSKPTKNDYYNGHFVISGKKVDPSSVNLRANTILNAKGADNVSFHPSGMSRYYQANNGTNQAAYARFSADSGPNSMVFYKSRGTTINTSKSAVAGDVVAQMTFLADNGKVDYTGTLQGASVAQIEAAVSESSTLTSAGTTNTAVRGVLRLTCNSDGTKREGSGVEIMDNTCRPTVDNVLSLGTSARRWKAIYSATGTISTSDEREKKDIAPISNTVLDAWEAVEFVQYRPKDGGEIFFGVIAQRIIEAFAAKGLNALDYGLVVLDADRYAVRYHECLILEAACVRRRLSKLEG